jgi:hypothetical protein
MSKETNIWLHEGHFYEFGQDYLFSNNELHWTYAALSDLDGGQDRVFCTSDKEWRHIKEVPASENMGKITPAPIELVDGAAYMFDSFCGDNLQGTFNEDKARLIQSDSWEHIKDCTNIRLMTVESK